LCPGGTRQDEDRNQNQTRRNSQADGFH